jgi:23S rRNA U2552 (ribose-2'-O)-methylase RlmE/FtsJ
MISNGMNDMVKREEALKIAIDVVKAQPGFLSRNVDGEVIGKNILEMADLFLKYVTVKPSQPV